jgi:hypothetical protein
MAPVENHWFKVLGRCCLLQGHGTWSVNQIMFLVNKWPSATEKSGTQSSKLKSVLTATATETNRMSLHIQEMTVSILDPNGGFHERYEYFIVFFSHSRQIPG